MKRTLLFSLLSVPLLLAFALLSGDWGQGVGAQMSEDRKIILILGIDSEGLGDDCDTSGNKFWERREAVRTAIQQEAARFQDLLLTEEDFLGLSYRDGAYCDSGFTKPRYGKADTCDGVASAAAELKRLVANFPLTTFDIVAHSMGGLVATYWAADPDQDGERNDDSDDDALRRRLHSIVTIDSPLDGTPRDITFNDIPIFGNSTCKNSELSWQDLTNSTSVVPTITNPSLVANRVNLVQIKTAVGDQLPGFWRSFGFLGCGLSNPFEWHSCAFANAGFLRNIGEAVTTEIFDDRDRNAEGQFDIPRSVDWVQGTSGRPLIRNAAAATEKVGASVEFSFTGSRVTLVYARPSGTGFIGSVQIDDGSKQQLPGGASCPRYRNGHGLFICKFSRTVANGNHTLKITVKGCSLCSKPFRVDAIEVLPETAGGGSSDLPWLATIVGAIALIGGGHAWFDYQSRRVR